MKKTENGVLAKPRTSKKLERERRGQQVDQTGKVVRRGRGNSRGAAPQQQSR